MCYCKGDVEDPTGVDSLHVTAFCGTASYFALFLAFETVARAHTGGSAFTRWLHPEHARPNGLNVLFSEAGQNVAPLSEPLVRHTHTSTPQYSTSRLL